MKRIFLTEEEKDDLSKKHEDIDRKLMNFLLRRYNVEKRTLPRTSFFDPDEIGRAHV
jgi:DNA-directed RNA polymerase subunit H (RpoH/RPB5)